MGIVVADVDNLKQVNDRYGHSVGDQLIQEAARVLRQSFRAEDIIARLGGDEFIVLLPKTDEAAAQAAVARLRAHVAEQPETEGLSLSIGLAVGHEGSSLLDVHAPGRPGHVSRQAESQARRAGRRTRLDLPGFETWKV